MLGNHLTAAIDIVLYLGTASRHGLLAALYVVAKLFFARVHVGVNVCRGFSRFLLQVFGAFARALGQTVPRVCTGLRSVENADRCTNSEPDQKPTETTSAVVLIIV